MSQAPLSLLCIEPRFPGRLGAVADWLVRRRGYRCQFFCHSAGPPEGWPPSVGRGLDVVAYEVGGVAREASVPWRRGLERGLCYAYGGWEVFDARRPRPIDAILARSDGLGSSLFAPVTFPRTPIVQFFDYYYHAGRHDLAPEVGPGAPPAYAHWRRAANAVDLLDLENGVVPWTPTLWQRDLYPPEYRPDFLVLHDGVDARRAPARDLDRPDRTIAGRRFPREVRVVTFVARALDRLRGFDRFVRLANALTRARPDVVAVAVGDPVSARMLDAADYGRDHAAACLAADPPPDPDRFLRLGPVAPAVVREVLLASDLHVAPGRDYPVARSVVEAMAHGCPILAHDGGPIREFLRPGVDADLVDFADPAAALAAALALLDDSERAHALGQSAAGVARARFDRDATLPVLADRLGRLAGLGNPEG